MSFPNMTNLKPFNMLHKMNDNTALHILTMGDAMDRREDLYRILSNCHNLFKHIRVVCCSLDNEVARLCDMYGVSYYYMKWENNCAIPFNWMLDVAHPDSWILHLDDDEMPSWDLLYNLNRYTQEFDEKGIKLAKVPFKHIIDGIVAGKTAGFTAERLHKRTDARFMGLSHLSLDYNITKEWQRGIILPDHCIWHYKSRNGYDFGDVWGSFINPEGHSSEKMAELKEILLKRGIVSSETLYSYLLAGNIDNEVKRFILGERFNDGCILHLFYYYFFVIHGEELAEWRDGENSSDFAKDKKSYLKYVSDMYLECVEENYGYGKREEVLNGK